MGLLQEGQAASSGADTPAPAAPDAASLAQSAAAAGAGTPPGAGAPPPAAAPSPAGGAPAPQQGLPQGGKATGEGVELQEVDATPEEQAEYERAMKAVATVLYSNEGMSNSIVDQVDPADKVSSTAKVSMLLIQQLDQKVDFDEIVVAEVTQEVVARVIELAEARHSMQYGDDEMQVILASTWEGVSEMFGGTDEQDLQQMMQSAGQENLEGLKQNHEAALRG